MKNISTGAGLAILGLGIALHPLLSGLASSATASASTAPAAAALASAASAQAGPTVVWMGSMQSSSVDWFVRLWSDGRLDKRIVVWPVSLCGQPGTTPSCDTGWFEIPPPLGGNGIACRTDLNGDGVIGSADLTLLLNEWGQTAECEATYPCLDLGNLAGGVALK